MKNAIKIMALLWLVPCWSLTFNVNTLTDGVDAEIGDGICEVNIGMGDCTLRAALNEVNEVNDAHIINLGEGIHLLTITGIDNLGMEGDLDVINTNITLNGLGADITIVDGGNIGRLFHLMDGVDFNISNLTLKNGRADSSDEYWGGAIAAEMTVTGAINIDVKNVHFKNNSANQGGAIYLLANVNMNIDNSYFSDNSVEDLGFTNLYGSAIYCRFCDNLNIRSTAFNNNLGGVSAIDLSRADYFSMINSTISDNDGFGLRTEDGNGEIRFSTFYSNGEGNYLGSSFDGSDEVLIMSSVFYKDSNANCTGHLPLSIDFNLSNDSTCGFLEANDLEDADPLLIPLSTGTDQAPYYLPDPLSPLVDMVDMAFCNDIADSGPLEYDQRGVSRPQFLVCDAGAIELSETEGVIFFNGFE